MYKSRISIFSTMCIMDVVAIEYDRLENEKKREIDYITSLYVNLVKQYKQTIFSSFKYNNIR